MGTTERKARERVLRKEQIINAAKSVFLEKGFSGATIEDIAKEAELSVGTLYIYFKNKDDLYASLNLRALDILNHEMDKILNDPKLSSGQKLEGAWKGLYNTFSLDPIALRAILHFQLEESLKLLSPPLLASINEVSKSIINKLALIFQIGIEKRQFKKANTMAMADFFWGVFTGLVLWEDAKRRINPKKDYLRPTLKLAFEIIEKGVQREG